MTIFNTVEEHNAHLKNEGLACYDKSFTLNFRDRKKNFFEVSYGTHGQCTQNPYFSTSAGTLNHVRSDYNIGGQAQERVLKNRKLISFYKKWDAMHLKVLTIEEYKELENDINTLKESIPYIESRSFNDIVKFDREISK